MKCRISSDIHCLPKYSLRSHQSANTRVGFSGTTAKSRQRKFVPSLHPGPFALVASPGKSKKRQVLSLVLIFCKIMSKICKNPAMLFHEDMVYLAKQAKFDVEKSFALR